MVEPTGAFCAIHPERGAVATCDHCGTFACSECIQLQDGRQICRTCLETGRVTLQRVPWEDRESLGFLPAAWKTVLGVSASPSTFFAQLSPQGTVGEAALFALIAMIPALVVGFVYQTLGMLAFGDTILTFFEDLPNLPPESMVQLRSALDPSAGSLVSNFVTSVLVGAPLWLAFLALFGIVQHAVLTVLGGASKSVEDTLRVAFYSNGVRFWEVIPLVSLVSGFWLLFVEGLGLAVVHRTDTWKGLVASWALALLCCFCCMGIPVALLFAGTLLP